MDLVDGAEAKADTTARLVQALSLRGRAAAVEDPANALAHFREAAHLTPTEPGSWAALAKVYELLGDAGASKKAAAKADVLRTIAGKR
mmetsp:Transcript_22215/g.68538  ORF Transcript_22215/g.68538 Transcript_22215/m.68538 type:complete len:88 (-) Transcript_22215:20-283(-)